MKAIIGNYEMTPVVHNLMKRDGVLLDGWEGKSDLTTCIRIEAGVQIATELPFVAECVAIDAMFLLNQMSTKPLWVKNGSDLAKEFCNRVEQQCSGAEMVIVGFEWYSEESLKQMAWKARGSKDKKKRNDYQIEPDTDLSKRCMKDINGQKSKEVWSKRFLSKRNNVKFIQTLLNLQTNQDDEVIAELSKLFCRSCCPKKLIKE